MENSWVMMMHQTDKEHEEYKSYFQWQYVLLVVHVYLSVDAPSKLLQLNKCCIMLLQAGDC